ncbi:MAG: glycosyltransferase family 2 protein [Rhodocyclaceae bacterium]|nr:glycosyltransferase family 2 protein [Rhodocyclaceae bacterium]
MKPNKLSAVLITRNAALQLPACLASLAFCDEVLVVDSGSDDDTVALARQQGARVIETHWRGFGPQKQFAVEQAAHDWVLCIDADERVSERLRESVLAALAAVPPAPTFKKHAGPPQVFLGPLGGQGRRPQDSRRLVPRSGMRLLRTERRKAALPGGDFLAYRFARCNRFMGRYLRHGEGYPDWSLRLFDRRQAHWSDDVVHEKVLTDAPVGVLPGDLLHDSAESLENYLAKQNRYSSLAAEAALAHGKRTSTAHLLLSPLLRFVKFYVLRRGFLDGVPGLVHILIGCGASFAKHAKMRQGETKARSYPGAT